MTVNQIKPTSGNILVKKMPDEKVSKSGIILNTPVNRQIVYAEVIAIGENLPYDEIKIEDEGYWIVKQADIIATVED